MQVLLTIGLIAVVAIWIATAMRRLAVMRTEIKLVWKKLEVDQSNEAIKSVYNNHVAKYNAALESFPSNVFAPLAGFKPARPF
jgi:hypothetical protein